MNALHKLADHYNAEILKRQLPEGGWSSFSFHQWCIETSCLCLLALRLETTSACTRGVELLSGCQNPNGSWPAFQGDDQKGSWVTALVVITLFRLGGDWKAVERGLSWLLETNGIEEWNSQGYQWGSHPQQGGGLRAPDHAETAQHKANGKTPGIPEENRCRIEVVAKEPQQRSGHRNHHQGEGEVLLDEGDECLLYSSVLFNRSISRFWGCVLPLSNS